MRVELEDGDYAELRHAKKIPHRQTMEYRRVFYRVAAAGAGIDSSLEGDELSRAAGTAMIEGGGLEAMDDLANALVLAVVNEWSFGPVDMDTLLDVPTSDLNEIQRRCSGQEYQDVLNPDFGPSPDPESPTKSSTP